MNVTDNHLSDFFLIVCFSFVFPAKLFAHIFPMFFFKNGVLKHTQYTYSIYLLHVYSKNINSRSSLFICFLIYLSALYLSSTVSHLSVQKSLGRFQRCRINSFNLLSPIYLLVPAEEFF